MMNPEINVTEIRQDLVDGTVHGRVSMACLLTDNTEEIDEKLKI